MPCLAFCKRLRWLLDSWGRARVGGTAEVGELAILSKPNGDTGLTTMRRADGRDLRLVLRDLGQHRKHAADKDLDKSSYLSFMMKAEARGTFEPPTQHLSSLFRDIEPNTNEFAPAACYL